MTSSDKKIRTRLIFDVVASVKNWFVKVIWKLNLQ